MCLCVLLLIYAARVVLKESGRLVIPEFLVTLSSHLSLGLPSIPFFRDSDQHSLCIHIFQICATCFDGLILIIYHKGLDISTKARKDVGANQYDQL
jgi:hypothetical protein